MTISSSHCLIITSSFLWILCHLCRVSLCAPSSVEIPSSLHNPIKVSSFMSPFLSSPQTWNRHLSRWRPIFTWTLSKYLPFFYFITICMLVLQYLILSPLKKGLYFTNVCILAPSLFLAHRVHLINICCIKLNS